MKKSYDYTKDDIVSSLKKVGLQNGDSVFLHSNLGFFGKLKDCNDVNDLCRIFEESIFEVIGERGTLVVPTFSLSFCNNQVYDKKNTPSTECGIFSEHIRKKENSKRTDDANFSVCAIGFKSSILTSNVPEHSFGDDSFWERFLKINGKICRFNLGSDFNTFIHYVEKCKNVSYRYDKKFSGLIKENNKLVKKKFIHFVRDLEDELTTPNLKKLDEDLLKKEFVNKVNLGKGNIICMSSSNVFDMISKKITKDPFYLINKEEIP